MLDQRMRVRQTLISHRREDLILAQWVILDRINLIIGFFTENESNPQISLFLSNEIGVRLKILADRTGFVKARIFILDASRVLVRGAASA